MVESRQSIYDKVARHLYSQGRQAMMLHTSEDFDGTKFTTLMCAYRTDTGEKCAAGAIMPDEAYRKEFEGKNPHWDASRPEEVQHQIAVACGCENHEDTDFLRYLQGVHDLHEPDQWPVRLGWVAGKYGLTPYETPEGWTPREKRKLEDVPRPVVEGGAK